MTIRRQYIVPNCTLVLEGLNEGSQATDTNSGQTLSILVNAQCQIVGHPQILQGGRSFWENLVKVVNAYAQEFLSGVHHPQEVSQEGDKVRLEAVEGGYRHRLTWYPGEPGEAEAIAIDLNTIQLFDLMEAVDQFLADSQTLPELSLALKPASRRYRQPDQPLAERVIPAVLGVGGLALAGLVIFFFPIPLEVEKPQPKVIETPIETTPDEDTPLTPPIP